MTRTESLLPAGIPKWIRCYDNGGKTFDRYTVVFTKVNLQGMHAYRGMSEHPSDPQGFGQWGQSEYQPIDRPSYSHIGKRIKFSDLPADCQSLTLSDYKDIWNL